MRKLITYFIKYPITGNVLMVLILVFGVMGMSTLRKTFFPESQSKLILVEAVYPGASADEIEKMIVLKVEEQLDGISGVERVTSQSFENRGVIKVESDSKFETQVVLQDVKNAIDRISSFPDAMEPASVYIKENEGFAISFALSGKVPLDKLKYVAENVESDLKAMVGISKVKIAGYPDQEIEISFRDEDLKKFSLTFDQVNRAIQSENLDLSGGTIKTEKEDIRIRGNNKVYTAKEIGEKIISNKSGRQIRLREVATVSEKWADDPNRKFFDGETAVVITINNTIHEDVGDIATLVLKYMEEFNQKNDVVQADLISDGSVVVEQRIELLTKNGVIGFILVYIFLSMFLHPSLAGWVAVAIPVSFGGMFILAAFFGISLNVISLFGMIIVIGILVDDGIVIAENIFQHHEEGKSPVQAAIDGTMEVLPAVFSAIMTTVVAFSLMFMLDGRMGDFFPEMGFVVVATLIFSLIEGAFILPAHIAHSKAVNKDRKQNKYSKLMIEKLTAFLDWIRVKTYEPLLRFAIKSPALVIIFTICLMVITIVSIKAGVIKMTFFPPIEAEKLNVTLVMQTGTTEKVTTDWINLIEKKVWEVSDSLSKEYQGGVSLVTNIEKTIGTGSENASLTLLLLPMEERNISGFEMVKDLKNKIGEIPGGDIGFKAASPFGKDVSIALYSNDHQELLDATSGLKSALVDLGSLKNIERSDKAGFSEINLTLKEKAYDLGLTSVEVLGAIRRGYFGQEVQRLQKGRDEIKVWLRYEENERNSIQDLENSRVQLRGASYLVSDLVNIESQKGSVVIEHIDGKRAIKVEAELLNPRIDNPGDILTFIGDSILPSLGQTYSTLDYSFEGQTRDRAKTGASAKKFGPIVLIIMLTIIVLTFRSFLQTFAVFIMIPFGMIGVGWGHFIHGAQMSMFSNFGMIALIGVMVNDSLVFISTLNSLMKKGIPFKEAIWKTGVSRFRPIILTSITTIAGLAPLIAETSFQAQFLIPMAIAIAYGLAIATVLTLVFLPALLILFNKLRFVIVWLKNGKQLNETEREPAVLEIEFENLKLDDEK